MPDTIAESRPGRERCTQTLVSTGMTREVAYTLAEDVCEMAGRNIADKIDALRVSLTGQIQGQQERIDAVETALTAQIQAQTDRIESFRSILVEHGDAIKSMETRHAESMGEMEARLTKLIGEVDARQPS